MRITACGASACLLALGRGALGLHTAIQMHRQAPEPIRQALSNFMDLQYSGNITIGGQAMTGVMDTGSFELVVFSKSCSTSCGVAAKYDEQSSSTFRRGNYTTVHDYGSGSCQSQDGRDFVEVGSMSAQQQDLWLAKQCQMPLLDTAHFNAIVGLGPPGEPEFMARWNIKQLQIQVDQFKALGEKVPQSIAAQKEAAEEMLKAVMGKRALLENLQLHTFSTCFGKQPGSAAWVVWSDRYRAGQPGVMRLPVAGDITWSVKLGNVGLGSKTFACAAQDCVAIVDTGTSLIGVASDAYDAAYETLNSGNYELDCSDLSHFPDLTLTLGGQQLSLPPSAYIGSIYGQMSEKVAGFMPRRNLSGSVSVSAAPCQLLLMDLGQEMTTLGAMWIMGMPFFRQYYTTFDLGTGRGDRSLLVMPPSPTCEPDLQDSVQTFKNRAKDDVTPRQVDASKIMLPRWLQGRTDSKL